MTEQTQEVTRESLKVNALLERISGLENEKADLRVELTVYAHEINRLQQELAKYDVPAEDDEAPTASTED